MKQYDVKYEVGDNVYIHYSRSIIQTRIDKIRITEQAPYIDGVSMKPRNGIVIDYLIVSKEEQTPSGGHSTTYDWVNQDDVYLTRDDLIATIE